MRKGPLPCPSESITSVKRCVPGANVSLRRRLTWVRVRSSNWRSASATTAGPNRSNISAVRRTPRATLAISALVSPRLCSG